MKITKFPNTIYRVSAKAIIKNEKGEVLCVKEGDDESWSSPGGGMDFGETIHDCLARELAEEVNFRGEFTEKFLGIETFHNLSENRDLWMMRIFFLVEPENLDFSLGNDAREMKFLPFEQFRDGIHDEPWIYKYGMMANAD